MLYTYLNDNQGMPYPFYGGCVLPFPMSVITGLGICIQADGDSAVPLFAGSVVIDATSVRMAICRRLSNDAIELVGMFYGNTDGFYTYIPSYISDAVYEDQTITPQMLRFVYADYAPVQGSTVSGDSVIYNTELDDIIENMQVFYSFVQANVGTVLGRIASTGFIQLGSIPEAAIGSYFGEFYIDPSCITYMPDAVYGYHTAYIVSGDTYPARQSIDIRASGLLTLSVNGSTATFGTTADANEADLVELENSTRSRISFINGYTISATATDKYPTLTLPDYGDQIKWTVLKNTDKTLILEVEGTTTFPSCYGDN